MDLSCHMVAFYMILNVLQNYTPAMCILNFSVLDTCKVVVEFAAYRACSLVTVRFCALLTAD